MLGMKKWIYLREKIRETEETYSHLYKKQSRAVWNMCAFFPFESKS